MKRGALRRLGNLPGLWLAGFAVAGLVLLMIAGDRIAARLGDPRAVPPAASAPPSVGAVHNEGAPDAALRDERSTYPLGGLRLVLVIAAASGALWLLLDTRRIATG